MSAAAGKQTFYRYENAEGRLTIVDSLERVPPELRQQAEVFTLDAAGPRPNASPTGAASEAVPGTLEDALPSLSSGLDWASVGVGFCGGIVASLVMAALFGRGRRSRWLLGAAGLVGLALGISVFYLGAARRAAGLGDGPIATPKQLVEDARKVVDQVENRQMQQEKQIEELEELAR